MDAAWNARGYKSGLLRMVPHEDVHRNEPLTGAELDRLGMFLPPAAHSRFVLGMPTRGEVST
jgi:hypothetical protein